MSLRVLGPGLYTLVVDLGRPHCRSLGVPVGGAADRTALALGNALVGNPPDAAALEFTLLGPTLEATCELACVVYGAPFELHSDRQPLTAGTTFTLTPGEVLQVRGTAEGARGYLCVRGGLQTPVILGSRSGLAPVQVGDGLPCLGGTTRPRFVRPQFTWDLGVGRARSVSEGWSLAYASGSAKGLRALPGPQHDWVQLDGPFFSPDGGSVPTHRVTPASDRMGLRLEGPRLAVPERELVSEPVCPGSVQVTRDGQCIVLGVDGQTIGGYPKVAQVISADLDLLGQLRPGDDVFFSRVELAEAARLYRDKQAELAAWVTRLRVASES